MIMSREKRHQIEKLTISFMPFLNLECKLASLEDIIVGLIPTNDRGEFWTREMCNWTDE